MALATHCHSSLLHPKPQPSNPEPQTPTVLENAGGWDVRRIITLPLADAHAHIRVQRQSPRLLTFPLKVVLSPKFHTLVHGVSMKGFAEGVEPFLS